MCSYSVMEFEKSSRILYQDVYLPMLLPKSRDHARVRAALFALSDAVDGVGDWGVTSAPIAGPR